jgi:hypothetical protein
VVNVTIAANDLAEKLKEIAIRQKELMTTAPYDWSTAYDEEAHNGRKAGDGLSDVPEMPQEDLLGVREVPVGAN